MDATDHMPVTSMLDDVLAPALCSIGTLWQHRELTVADEHIATAICHRLLAQLSTNLQIAPAKTREKILLVSPSAERHTLGLLMTHNVLYGAGFDALLIGEGTRDSDLKAALLRHEPAIVALSATMSDEDAFADAARTIHEILPDSRIITGGASARELPAEIPAHFVERLDTVVEAVEGCLAPGRQRAL